MKNELLQKALVDNERLLRMIDNVLMASKAENEEAVLHKQKVNLSEIVLNVIDQTFSESKKRVQFDLVEDFTVEADAQLLSIIFSNLIENALKYSQANSIVVVEVGKQNSKPFVSIKDNGIGISDVEKHRIFEKFYRVGNEETRSAKGTGLGLFITKYLCDLHQVKITVSNNSPIGTIFTLFFS